MTSLKKVKRRSIQSSDPGKILDLIMCLTDDACSELQIKINNYLKDECEAELVFLVVVNSERMETSIQAVGHTVLARKKQLSIFSKFTEVLRNNIEQTELLTNFPTDFQTLIGPYLQSSDQQKKRVLIFPIPDKPFAVIACVVAPTVLEEIATNFVHECFLFAWPTLKKSIMMENESILKMKCQQLLRVARRLFSQVASLETLLQITMDQVKILTKAEYCTVLLVDTAKMELVDNAKYRNVEEKRRFPMDVGIAGQVVKTGSLVNAKIAKEHPAFNADIDGYPGVETRTLLCFPIREQSGIIGVGQIINKIFDPYFDAMDEEMALAFSIYCGVSIMHSVIYQKLQEAHVRNTLANELVMYHMKVTDAEVTRLLECTNLHNHPHFNSLHLNTRALPLRELPCYAMKMFIDLGFDETFNIHPSKLARFILYAKKGYRDVPYHCWFHAFSVAQWAYAAIFNNKLIKNGYFTELQAFIFLVASLVHDIDHRGTTNSFHIQGQTTLAALYSSEGSVMERHHVTQAMAILNTAGCEILESLPRRDYDKAIALLRDYILASDLANYYRNINDYKAIAQDFQKANRYHITALQALLMNAADLSDQLKDWDSIKKTATAVLTEFFKQGEMEKNRGEHPMEMMDKDKCFIPDLQIQFLQNVCMPLYDTLGRILPKLAGCSKILESHIQKWDASRSIFAEVPITEGLSVLLSPELDNLIEFNIQEKERLRLEAEAAAAAEAAAEAADKK